MAESKGYEFSLAETSTLDDLTSWMRVVAVGAVLLGAFDVITGVLAATKTMNVSVALTMLVGVLWGFVGIWMWGAAKAMKNVTMTEGNDMVHFMSALSSMQKVYFVQAIFVGINALLLLSVLVV